jgi:DNA invertase Pin-like site-specific DNA recombinase
MRLEMQIGYARSSTVDQEAGFQAQIKSLKAAGCEKVFAEKVSSVAERAQLEAALDYAREGDILVVTKLDRLARSVSHLVAIGGRKRRPSLLGCLSKPSTRPIAPAV